MDPSSRTVNEPESRAMREACRLCFVQTLLTDGFHVGEELCGLLISARDINNCVNVEVADGIEVSVRLVDGVGADDGGDFGNGQRLGFGFIARDTVDSVLTAVDENVTDS